MADILNPLPEITEAKAKGLRNFFYEYVIIALTIAVITLFGLYYNQNSFILHLMSDTISRNTTVIERNNDYLNNKH